MIGNKETISLGSLGLAQFEELKRKNEEIAMIQKEQTLDMEATKKVEANLDMIMKKVIDLEEYKARQKALRMKEEKKIMELEQDKKVLMDLINKQQGVIDRCADKIEMWETREKEMEDITDVDLRIWALIERMMIPTTTMRQWIIMLVMSLSPLVQKWE